MRSCAVVIMVLIATLGASTGAQTSGSENPSPAGEPPYFEQLPEAIAKVEPTYPEIALEAGIDGEVTVKALVGRDGSVVDVRVVKSIPMLDAAAIRCARQWRFKPAIVDGKPVAVWVAIPLRFVLPPVRRTGGIIDGIPAYPAEPTHPRFEPRVIHLEAPVYPELACEARVEGTVGVLAHVLRDGAVGEVKIIRSSPMLDAAARDCARRWRFIVPPATVRPESTWVVLEFPFTLPKCLGESSGARFKTAPPR